MRDSFPLGRLAGVRVDVNWSVLVIFVLVAYGLAAGQFPAEQPGRSALAYAVAGVVAAFVFFGSLLAHELAHAVVARHNGIEVDGITLWLFGGVARLHGEAADPRSELKVAGVGPLVSVVLAAVFFGVLGLFVLTGTHGLVASTVGWLGAINLALAVFNVVPAAPLDGGRLLRAYLWWRRGDRYSAAVTAARAGRAFGFVLIVGGLFEFLAGQNLGGLWLALIGWFLVGAAGAEERQAVVQGALRDVTVGQVMTPQPATLPADVTVTEFLADHLFRWRYASFLRVDAAGRPTGLVTISRIREVPDDRRSATTLGAVGTPLDRVPQARPDEPVLALLARLSEGTDGRALVLDDGRLVGIVSPSDVNRVVQRLALAPRRP